MFIFMILLGAFIAGGWLVVELGMRVRFKIFF